MPKPYIAEHFQLGGDKPTDSIDKYEKMLENHFLEDYKH